MNSDNRTKVLAAIAEYLYDASIIRNHKVDENVRLFEDLKFDTLDCIEFVMFLEDTYQTAISAEAAEKFLTVKDAVDYVIEHGLDRSCK